MGDDIDHRSKQGKDLVLLGEFDKESELNFALHGEHFFFFLFFFFLLHEQKN